MGFLNSLNWIRDKYRNLVNLSLTNEFSGSNPALRTFFKTDLNPNVYGYVYM